MNNLKFRAWDKTHEVYYDVSGINIRNNKIVIFMGYSQQRECLVEIDFDEVVVEQYTCLRDVNGTEIYVGDLIEVPNDYDTYRMMAGCIREVYFKDGSYRLKPLDNFHNQRGHLIDDCNDLKVIGNIHENGDLLK